MPINGLTKSREELPLLGVFRKGDIKKPKSPGKSLDYFRFTPTNPVDDSITKEMHDLLGEQPKQIRFWLPYATVNENFEAWMESYGKGGLMHRCDGVNVLMKRGDDGRMRNYTEGALPCESNCGCKPRGRLYIIVHGLQRDGVIMVPTGSKIDIKGIYSSMHLHANRAKRFGVNLQDLPLILLREPQEISVPAFKKDEATGQYVDTGNRTTKTHYMIKIQAAPEYSAFLDRIRVSRLEHASKLLGASDGLSIDTSPVASLPSKPESVPESTVPTVDLLTVQQDEIPDGATESDVEGMMKTVGLLPGDYTDLDDLRIIYGIVLWRKLDAKKNVYDQLDASDLGRALNKLSLLKEALDEMGVEPESRTHAWTELIDGLRAKRIQGSDDLNTHFLGALETVLSPSESEADAEAEELIF